MARRGPHPRNRLTDLMVRQAGPGRHMDGRGLHVYVRPGGYRSWVHRVTIHGRRYDIGLGPCADVGLAEARARALENCKIIRQGGDPRKTREAVPTVRQMVESVIETRRPNWKTAGAEQGFRHLFEKYVFPKLGSRRIDDVGLQDMLAILTPIWGGRRSQGYVLRQHLSAAMRSAIAHGYRTDDPAARAKDLLPKVQVAPVHLASLPYRQAPAALSAVLASDVDELVRLFVVFTVLTAARFSEAANATWPEMIDVDGGDPAWLVPAERMKAGSEHKVPLARQTLEVLSAARRVNPAGPFVFRRGRRRFPRKAVTELLRGLDLKDEKGRPAVMHGFRATFRVRAMELGTPFEVCEAALAHLPSSQTVAAYARSDLFALRRTLMQEWGDFVLPEGVVVTACRPPRS